MQHCTVVTTESKVDNNQLIIKLDIILFELKN